MEGMPLARVYSITCCVVIFNVIIVLGLVGWLPLVRGLLSMDWCILGGSGGGGGGHSIVNSKPTKNTICS